MNKIQLPTEFDPYRDSTDLPIELLAIKEEKWTQIAHEVIGENSESRKKGLTDLKSRCTDLKLPFLNDEKLSDEEKSTLESKFWLMVLRAGGMDPERAHQVLMNYIGIINQHPEYFAASKPPTKLDPVFQQKIHGMLQYRDQYGRRIYYYRPGRWNPDTVHFNEVFCAGYSLCEMIAKETKTQIAGVTVICDADGFGFKQLRHFTIQHARSSTSFVQDSFPLWFRSIHVVNASRLFYVGFNIVRPFLNDHIRNAIHFHTSMETLHEEIPKEILPQELGGDTGPFDNYESAKAVFDIEPHFYRVQEMIKANKELQ